MKSSIMHRLAPIVNEYVIDDEDDDDSSILEDEIQDCNMDKQSGTHLSRSTQPRISTASSNMNTTSKRAKDISPCYVCGAKAHGYNFDQITCESCKAFFRRNALKSMDRFRCRNNDSCVITTTTRKRCKKCRLMKCFKVGMRKEWILTEEEKRLKRKKIERNRFLKQQAQMALQNKQAISTDFVGSGDSSRNSVSSSSDRSPTSSDHHQQQIIRRNANGSILPLPMMCMYPASDKQLYESQKFLLKQLSEGYHGIIQKYPQPHKFLHRKHVISQTEDMETKLYLVKDITRELTQMTTSRLLNYFNLIPEFHALTESEKRSVLIKNMLTVFMFHGALTYDSETDSFVDRNTTDHPYDAKYLLLVYGPKVYYNFVNLARGLTSAAYQSLPLKESDGRVHNLFLLLMNVLLFNDRFDASIDVEQYTQQQTAIEHSSAHVPVCRSLSTTSESGSSVSSVSSFSSSSSTGSRLGEKLQRIQQHYMEITCRYLYDEFGAPIGRQMFHTLLPLLYDLHKLCSTLANVNLCESAESESRSISSSHPPRAIIDASRTASYQSPTETATENSHLSNMNNSRTFNPTMISGRAHLNELQKENRAPPRSTSSQSVASSSISRPALGNASISSSSSSTLVLSDTITAFENHRLS